MAVAAAVAFVVSSNRAGVPVIHLKMFRTRVFASSNIAIVIAAKILGIQLLGLSLFLQQSWHWLTIATGLALAPGPAAVLEGSFIAPRLQQRFPIGAVVAFGFVLTAVGQVLMILTLHHGVHNYAAAILPGWVVIGLGFTVPTIIGSATVDRPPEPSATGSAVVNSGRQFGGVFGASILVVVLRKAEVTGDPGRVYELWGVAVALCAAAVFVSLGLTPNSNPPRPTSRFACHRRLAAPTVQSLESAPTAHAWPKGHVHEAPSRCAFPIGRPRDYEHRRHQSSTEL